MLSLKSVDEKYGTLKFEFLQFFRETSGNYYYYLLFHPILFWPVKKCPVIFLHL